MLAIVWANEFASNTDDPEFDEVFGEREHLARAIVNRAINDWNRAIVDLNYDDDENAQTNVNAHLELTILARNLDFLMRRYDPTPMGGPQREHE